MAEDIRNVGQPTVINRGFVPMAAEAGLTQVIRSTVGQWGMDIKTLLYTLKGTLWETNQPLAEVLNLDNLTYYLLQGANSVNQVVMLSAVNYPVTVPQFDADLAGPVGVWASLLDANRVTVTFSEPLTNDLAWGDGDIHFELYYDGVYAKTGQATWVDGASTIDAVINTGAEIPSGTHTVRVLFLGEREDGGVIQSRFGSIAELTV